MGVGMVGRHPSRGLPLPATEVMGVITKAATLQCVSAQDYLQQQLPGVLCLERNFIIPQTLGLSAAAQSLANPAGSSCAFFVYENAPQYNPSLF